MKFSGVLETFIGSSFGKQEKIVAAIDWQDREAVVSDAARQISRIELGLRERNARTQACGIVAAQMGRQFMAGGEFRAFSSDDPQVVARVEKLTAEILARAEE